MGPPGGMLPALSGSPPKGPRPRQAPLRRAIGDSSRAAELYCLSGCGTPPPVGGLRPASICRTAVRYRVSGTLRAPCGHFQSPPAHSPKRASHFQLQRLPPWRLIQTPDAECRRVHPPLAAACSSGAVPAHSLLRVAGQLPSCAPAGALPATANHAGVSAAAKSASVSGLRALACRPPHTPALSQLRRRAAGGSISGAGPDRTVHESCSPLAGLLAPAPALARRRRTVSRFSSVPEKPGCPIYSTRSRPLLDR